MNVGSIQPSRPTSCPATAAMTILLTHRVTPILGVANGPTVPAFRTRPHPSRALVRLPLRSEALSPSAQYGRIHGGLARPAARRRRPGRRPGVHTGAPGRDLGARSWSGADTDLSQRPALSVLSLLISLPLAFRRRRPGRPALVALAAAAVLGLMETPPRVWRTSRRCWWSRTRSGGSPTARSVRRDRSGAGLRRHARRGLRRQVLRRASCSARRGPPERCGPAQ